MALRSCASSAEAGEGEVSTVQLTPTLSATMSVESSTPTTWEAGGGGHWAGGGGGGG